MRFRKQTTFNSHDTKFETGSDGRLVINQERGVQARMDLAIAALLRFGPRGASAEVVTQHLNRRLKANYSVSDIFYACKRLVNASCVRQRSGGRGEECIFVATQAGQKRWKDLPKK